MMDTVVLVLSSPLSTFLAFCSGLYAVVMAARRQHDGWLAFAVVALLIHQLVNVVFE